MYERFTDRARRAVELAQDEARLHSKAAIGTEHLLIGLMREGDGAATAIESLGISLEQVRGQVQEFGVEAEEGVTENLPFTPRADKALGYSLREALQLGHSYIGTEHILLGLIREGEGRACQILVAAGAPLNQVRRRVIEVLASRQVGRSGPDLVSEADRGDEPPLPALLIEQFGRNLTQAAREGRLDPVIGREEEIERVMQVLSRRTKNNPVLIGEPGVGKTAVVEGLAQRIVEGEVPETLEARMVFRLDVALVAGSNVGGDFAKHLTRALEQAAERDDIVLFIDEIHALVGGRADNGALDVASILKPLLARGELQTIGATTLDEYRRHIEKDAALERRFQPIQVHEPTLPHAIETLKGLRDLYEGHHKVTITDGALVRAAELAPLYTRDSFLPYSAIDLLDEASARIRVRGKARSSELRELDETIASLVFLKEAAVDAMDFERAARVRSEEKEVRAARATLEESWKRATAHLAPEVDEDVINQVVSDASGIPVAKLPSLYQLADRPPAIERQNPEQARYSLIGDHVVTEETYDLLNTSTVAKEIADLLRGSAKESPLVVGIDGGWGMGKSTLLSQIEQSLAAGPDLIKVSFNAWTAHGDNALEGLIKSVLFELDANRLRRLVKKLSQRRGLMLFSRIGASVVARLFGVDRIINDLWERTGADAQARNEFRSATQAMLKEWSESAGTPDQRRSIVVFVDDLDRCSDEVVVQVCEAVKLYLDAPGLIFVIACDLSVLARGVAVAARGGEGEGRTYLEKIVQVAHRVPAPTIEQVRELIAGYAQNSGTHELIDGAVIDLLAEGTGRNPRRIKRVINSFVMEYRLNPAWHEPPLGSTQLITAVLIQHLYPGFYERVLISSDSDDPIGEFLDYVDLKARASDPPASNSAWWSVVSRTFRRHGLGVPDRSAADVEELRQGVTTLETLLPTDFPTLTRTPSFVALLRGLGDAESRHRFREQLMSRPVGPLEPSPLLNTNVMHD